MKVVGKVIMKLCLKIFKESATRYFNPTYFHYETASFNVFSREFYKVVRFIVNKPAGYQRHPTRPPSLKDAF